ncbi:DNA gyrase subunit A [Candidatus Koribacter versatilis Ellin345]|uniref:DNA gyrase subunit A n=1 Tax=Koribacter versatilis (strain Ellin345) TaxID=204669 RepID=Q1IH79_KORVE|nr:DNA gyrase subunit A [Candidatus Koribacter versatilis]ABF43771.1 DNA gyrase subunit A [Candidatus Koribacter versatilis Ellin345]
MADEQNPLLPLPPSGDGGNPQNIQPINIEEEMKRSYLDYSMSVIIGRALPDVRDGLKPVHRRILYAMHDMGLLHNRKHVKCAKVVGEVLGKYHPHGDSAVYDAMVRMAQDFSLRYPLVDGQGNFGSVDGDPPAAYRYTEARMTAIAEELLADIDKDTVDFVANFDDTSAEPLLLPTKVPNLLINGSNGIAVGMATNIPPHNLTEIVDACITIVNNPKSTLDDVLKFVQGPDFPTGGFIHGKGGIKNAYQNGRGRFMMRAKVAVEHLPNKDAIVVTEIPYQVNKSTLIKKIADLVNDKTIDEISDVRDESDRDGMRIVIELKRSAQPEIVLNQLYKHTQMQESFSMIFLAVVNNQPKEMGLVQALNHFIDHRIDVVRRRTFYLLQKAKDREHILEGYLMALDHLDNVIAIIRGSSNRADARENLVAYFTGKKITINTTGKAPKVDPEKPFSTRQADAILELQLHRLTRLSIDEITSELKDVRERIAEYESILASEKKLRSVIVKELEQIRKDYGDERRTIIQDEAAELSLEDLIADEQVAVTVSHSGYLKRTPISTYRQQRRGGTGRKGMSTRDEDFVEMMFVASTHAYLLIFTNTGRVYWLKVYEVPEIAAAGKGKHIGNLVALQPGESVRAILPVKSLEEESRYVFFTTRKGTVKKTALVDFSNVMARGIIAIGIDKDDELVAAQLTDSNQIVFLASHEGLAIRFDEADVRIMGRPAYGVRGMDIGAKDYIVGMAITPKERKKGKNGGADTANLILSVTENGYGKRTDVDEYRLQTRGGKGVINVKTTERNGKVVAIMLVTEDAEAMVISQYGKIIRTSTDSIREAGRSTQGVRLLHLEPGDKVAAAVVIPDDEKAEAEPTLLQ